MSNKDEDEEGVNLAPPVMTITVSSDANLELTVTKTCLVMLGKLGEVSCILVLGKCADTEFVELSYMETILVFVIKVYQTLSKFFCR